ncbi:MAG: hypothetical protein ACLFTQ_00715 [Candidatus Aenigmatarchaeota archaeon]
MSPAQFPGGATADLLGGEFFEYALPWLLTFAIVYGFLQHYKVPESKSARGVISIVLAFFVMPAAAPVMSFLREVGAGLVVIVTGIIFFLVLLELTRTKKHPGVQEHPQTGEEIVPEGAKGADRQSIVEAHPKTFGALVVIILVVILWGAGGFEIMGLGEIIPMVSWPTLFFLAVLALAIWWMISESE